MDRNVPRYLTVDKQVPYRSTSKLLDQVARRCMPEHREKGWMPCSLGWDVPLFTTRGG